MAKAININSLETAIESILKDYSDVVFKATDESMSAGEKVLIKNLKSASPSATGEYKKSWRGTGKKYKLKRYVGNSKLVQTDGGEMPLSNILEYAEKSKYKGLIKRTYESSANEIASAIVNEIKKGV
jgi:hypothetical protein